MTIRPIDPRIAFVVVELDDGRWTRFSKEDIEAVRSYALTSSFTEDAEPRLWKLLAFITSLSLEPMPDEPRLASAPYPHTHASMPEVAR